MAEVCGRCKGHGWYWNGKHRVTCRRPQPTQVHEISREEWPAYAARLAARRAR
jgi:hypothetical protein